MKLRPLRARDVSSKRSWFRVLLKVMSFLCLVRAHLAFRTVKGPTNGRRFLGYQHTQRLLLVLQQRSNGRREMSNVAKTTTTTCWFSSSETDDNLLPTPKPMANLYQEWSLQEDQLLWDNKNKPSTELASLLGRGMRGVEARLAKLKDLSSPAYERLFASGKNNNQEEAAGSTTKPKLVPAGEVLRRVQWDYMLDASDFSILHYDRVEDSIMETPMDAPNESIGGTSETLLVKALPEHRIEGIKYKERLVWDRQDKLDLVFGDPGIYDIIETYSDWKKERDQVLEWNRQRQAMVAQRTKEILGLELFTKLQSLSTDLQKKAQDVEEAFLTTAQIETYVSQAMDLFRSIRNDPTLSLDPAKVPTGEYDALDELSELIAVLPDAELRSSLLTEISKRVDKIKGNAPSTKKVMSQSQAARGVVLAEDDLTESFVRGSGAGGQKINKTSNRVVLVHEPTQLRVECQDTRSLQQNRKIARKRLVEKLDEYYNGRQSKVSMKQQKASQKRNKKKSKNRARLRKKQKEKEEQEQ